MDKYWLLSIYSDSTIRIRMQENELVQRVYLRCKVFGCERLVEMHEDKRRDGLIYYACTMKLQEAVLRYQFYVLTTEKVYYYTQYRITDYMPEESRDFILLADYQAPLWVQKSVFYQIFPDRFCNGVQALTVKDGEYQYDGNSAIQVKDWNQVPMDYSEAKNLDFYGGDLYGVIEKLDYLQDLGVNAIYLNPILMSPSIHRYDILDFYHVDTHLGGDDALIKLSEELHKRGMRLVLDIAINHTSSSSEWFNKKSEFYDSSVGAYQNESSEYRDYFFIEADGHYDCWFGFDTMPKLNYGCEKLRDTMYRSKDSVLKKWVMEPYNIDAWRFDTADCIARNETIDVHQEVLRELRKSLKDCKKDIYLLAEDWTDCTADLQGDMWDGTMNYISCARAVRSFLAN